MALAGVLRLRPEHVSRMSRGFPKSRGRMTIKNGSTESAALLGIPIGAKRQMASRDYELELAAAGSAENGNTLVGPPRTPSRIILELLEKPAVPIGIHNSLEYLMNQ